MDTTAAISGRRRLNQALSDRAVKAARAPGRMFDGNGLFLLVTEHGPNVSKVWKQRSASWSVGRERVVVHGRERVVDPFDRGAGRAVVSVGRARA